MKYRNAYKMIIFNSLLLDISIYIFQVFPHQIVNEASFTIRVKSSGDDSTRKLLDYEKNKVYQ